MPLTTRTYRTTPAQRAQAAAWREANREKSRAYARTYREAHGDAERAKRRARWAKVREGSPETSGRPQRPEGVTRREADRAYYLANREAILEKERARRRAKGMRARVAKSPEDIKARKNELQRIAYAAFQAAFVGPLRPRNWRSLTKPPATPKPPRVKLVKAPRPPRPPKAAKVPSAPRAPSQGALRRQEAQDRKATLAAEKAQAAQDRTEAQALARAGREWDKEAYRVFRSYVVALQKARSKQRRTEWQRQYDARKARTPEEREAARVAREAAQAQVKAIFEAEQVKLREQAEAARVAQEARDAVLAVQRLQAQAEAEALRSVMAAPRRLTRV